MKKYLTLILILFNTHSYSQWTNISYLQNSIKDICFYSSSSGCIVGGNGFMMSTSNGGINWFTFGSFTGNTILKLSKPFGAIGYAACDGGVILKTSDFGFHWIQLNTGTTAMFKGISFINVTTGMAVGIDGLIRYTTNGGLSWLTRTSFAPLTFNGVVLLDANNSIAAGNDPNRSAVERTTDGGITWTTIYNLNNAPPNIYYSFNGLDFININTGFVCGSYQVNNQFSGVIYRTSDGGLNWSSVAASPDNALNSINFINANTGFCAGNNGEILHTTNGGLDWQEQASNTVNSLTNTFFFNPLFGHAVGNNGTILRTTNGGITGFKSGENVIHNFELSQNYPNPFNPVTKIKFELPKSDFVTLKIYNILGSDVVALINENLNAGTYEVNWDASNYASGVYYYKITCDDFSDIKKMVLIK